jgi:hypothetical protein
VKPRLSRELKELTGTEIDSKEPLDPIELTTIDSMHYNGRAGTDTMLRRFPDAKVVLDFGAGYTLSAAFIFDFD